MLSALQDPEQDIDEEKTYHTISTTGALPPVEEAKRPSGFLCGGKSSFETIYWNICFISNMSLRWISHLLAECGAENHLQAKDPVRCRECGYRIMYKKRARRRTFRPSCEL